MDSKLRNDAARRGERGLHWWHLGALVGLVVAVEGGRTLLRGAGAGPMLGALPHALYPWCPILAGIAISIRRSSRGSSRAALEVGLVVTLFMVALDLSGELRPPPPRFTTTVDTQGHLQSGWEGDTGRSWALTGLAWVRGELEGVGERVVQGGAEYSGPHPRGQAAQALYDGSLVLGVFGILGLVVAAGGWIRRNVTFRRREDERGAHLVMAWLLAPLAHGVTKSTMDRFLYSALFAGDPLWSIVLPAVALLTLGLYLWVRTTRTRATDPGEPADG